MNEEMSLEVGTFFLFCFLIVTDGFSRFKADTHITVQKHRQNIHAVQNLFEEVCAFLHVRKYTCRQLLCSCTTNLFRQGNNRCNITTDR